MITITIDNPELERVYHGFNGNDEKFVEFISSSCYANNLEYNEDLSYLQDEIDEGFTSEDSGYTLDEAFDMLMKKYNAN